MATLGLHSSLLAVNGGPSLVATHRLLIAVASLVAEHGLWGQQASLLATCGFGGFCSRAREHSLHSCGAEAWLPEAWGIFPDQGSNLRLQILTIEPPGRPLNVLLFCSWGPFSGDFVSHIIIVIFLSCAGRRSPDSEQGCLSALCPVSAFRTVSAGESLQDGVGRWVKPLCVTGEPWNCHLTRSPVCNHDMFLEVWPWLLFTTLSGMRNTQVSLLLGKAHHLLEFSSFRFPCILNSWMVSKNYGVLVYPASSYC